jgi:hypothetical protein
MASNLKKDEQELDQILESIATEQKRREKLIYLQKTNCNDICHQRFMTGFHC